MHKMNATIRLADGRIGTIARWVYPRCFSGTKPLERPADAIAVDLEVGGKLVEVSLADVDAAESVSDGFADPALGLADTGTVSRLLR